MCRVVTLTKFACGLLYGLWGNKAHVTVPMSLIGSVHKDEETKKNVACALG